MAEPNFAQNPLVAEGHISESALRAYYEERGRMPSFHRGPDGKPVLTASVAKALGAPQLGGTFTNITGTQYATASKGGATPTQGVGSVYTPASVQKAVQQAAGKDAPGAMKTLVPELYSRAGVLDPMSNAGIQQAGPAATVQTPIPARSRTAATATARGDVPASITQPHPNATAVNDFLSWFAGQGPRMEGPLGDIYNVPAGREFQGAAGMERIFPGMAGKSFGASDTLLPERLQTYQLPHGQAPYGPLSEILPPHFIQRYGYGPEHVLGGQYSMGQVAAGDPSQSRVTQGALDWYNQQTPSGPYAGYQFPQGPFGPSTTAPAGSTSQYNPFPGFGQPGWQPFPGSTGGTGGGTFNPNPFPPPTTQPPPGGTGGPPLPPGGGTGTGTGTGTGGGAGGPGGGNPFPEINIQYPSGGTAGGGAGSPDQFLADTGADMGYLRGIAENAGYATNATPAWQAMVDAQQRQLERNFADLTEGFNVSGNRFSSVFGDAATDYWTQAGKDQNALLGQMTLAAQEAARQRELQAAGQLSGQGFGAGQQLSAQNFESLMNQMNQRAGLTSQMFGASTNAAQQLLQNAMQGAQSLYGTENQAAMAEVARQLQLLGVNLDTAQGLDQTWMQNLATGLGIGQSQYSIQQDQLQRLYNEWLRTQPEYNPLLPYQYSAATGYPPTAFPQYQPPMLPSLLGGLGGILGGLGGLFNRGGGGLSAASLVPTLLQGVF